MNRFITLGIFVAITVGVFFYVSPYKPANQTASNQIEEAVLPTSAESLVHPKAVPIQNDSRTSKNELVSGGDNELSRFDELRQIVLLNRNQLAEKETLLSDLKTIRWAESYLSAVARNDSEAKRHLSAIDFLEESIAWKGNPAMTEALESIENVITANQLRDSAKSARRLVVGDKIELFTILAQEEPTRARALLAGTDDPKIRDILKYAVKRLSLGKLLSEDQ